MPQDIDIAQFFASMIVIFFAIGIHEFAHCWFADAAGDPTPRSMGRVTLNLFKHFEPVGTFMIVFTSLTGYGIGWGKAAPMNPARMDNPRRDFFFAVAAGPLSNVLQAAFFGFTIRVLASTGLLYKLPQFAIMLLFLGVFINIGLFLFNLIPLGPLDGQWLVGLLLP
ncbi:MAG: site-2 protease family protein, partial [Armatimonadetes bacterium]|nr:site-2 protease family protein [Armatimonadota bacterium]